MNLSVSAKQMHAIDQFTIKEIGIPSPVLMERASLAIAERIITDYKKGKIGVICGTGNNGGDGIAIGRLLYLRGYDVTLYLTNDFDNASDQAKKQLSIARNLNVPIKKSIPDSFSRAYSLLVDAIFGIGLNREIDDHYKSVIDIINKTEATIVSVDIPSGLEADSGEPLNTAVKAEKTYTIGYLKNGFKKKSSKQYTGEIEIIDIDYPPYELIKPILESEEDDE